MASKKMRDEAVEDLLALLKCAHGEHELGKKRHPDHQKKGKDDDEIDENIEPIGLNAPHAINLPAIYDQQEYQPAKDIKPGSSIKRSFIHATIITIIGFWAEWVLFDKI